MSGIYEQLVEDGVFEEIEPARVDVVPLAASMHGARQFAPTRPDPTFLTQLIATAERFQQARDLRRASPAEALSAYRASQGSAQVTGLRTRQII
jgi:hypothetical protein